ncbi:MAG: NUDIX domain-containing protein [Ginsengibacter sp.]
MATSQSAGILLYRKISSEHEVFIVHPGGPFWKNKEEGAWSIPKGEFDDNENSLDAAKREFFEETGISLTGEFIELQPVKLKSGKKVYAWAIEKDIDSQNIISNNFEMEWPPRSGKFQSFPEIDKGEWLSIEEAKKKINEKQVSLLEQLQQILSKR